MNVYDELAEKINRILEKEQLMEEDIVINAKTLTAKEAIGQSFTSYPASYKGTLFTVRVLDLGEQNIGKPVIFYGTTIAGAATLLNLERACFFPG